MEAKQQQQRRRRKQKQKQCVWLVRYGLTEHPLVEDLGPYDGDIDPTEGIEHAKSIAKRIAAGNNNDGGCDNDNGDNDNDNGDDDNDDTIPTVVYASPFLRTAHTGHIIANELRQRQRKRGDDGNDSNNNNNNKVQLRLEEGLWEWLIPSLLVTKCDGIKTNPKTVTELNKILDGSGNNSNGNDNDNNNDGIIAVDYQSVNPYDVSGDNGIVSVPKLLVNNNRKSSIQNSDSDGGRPPRWTESEEDLIQRCETTLSRILDDDNNINNNINNNNNNNSAAAAAGESICIVSHAPCDQAMAFYLETKTASSKTTRPQDSKLTPWPLGGITMFSRPIIYTNDKQEQEEEDDEQNKQQQQQPAVAAASTTAIGFGEWTMELYGDTEHMPGDYKNGLKEWSLPCFTK